MSLYNEAVPQLVKMLANLDGWLSQAEAFAETRGFAAENLLSARLFPDMFPLTRQVQSACDAAKFVGARLAGVEAPKHPDTETTFAELHARIASVQAFLQGLDVAAFEGGDERVLSMPMLGGDLTCVAYLREFGLPNFYFHVTTAYALLRQGGVPLGKRTFIGSVTTASA